MPRGYDRILIKYNGLPQDTKAYLGTLPNIIDIDNEDTLDLLIAYLFIKVERGHRRLVYGVAVRDYRVDKNIAMHGTKDIVKGINIIQMSRKDFYKKYKLMAKGVAIDTKIEEIIKYTEKCRNEVMHGKIVNNSKKAETVKLILDYIKLLNEQAKRDLRIKPFGSMQGFAGRRITLGKRRSQTLLAQIVRNEIPPQ